MEETTSPSSPPAPAFLTGAVYGALAVLGAMLGVLGSFEFSWEAGGVPVAAIAWSLVNLAVFRGAGWALRGKLGAVVPAVFWLIVVLVLSSRRPEGDLVVTGLTPGYIFIFGGAIAAVIAVSWTPSLQPWMLGPAATTPEVRR